MLTPSRVAYLIVACVLASPSLLGATPTPVAKPATTPAPTQAALPTVWSGDTPPFGFTGGAESVDALLDQFLAAVTAGDLAALERLRVTKEEYGSIIVPGEAPKGQPPRTTYQKANDVFFGMLDSRSRYAAQAIVDAFKGKKIARRELTYSKGTREWLWYTGRGEVRLVLFDDQGERYELKTGWIAEVDGRFKFIGFNWDN